MTEGETVEFSLTVVDANGDSARVYSKNLPEGASLSDSGDFKWTAGYEQAGKHEVRFLADNGKGVGETTTVIEVIDIHPTLLNPSTQSH